MSVVPAFPPEADLASWMIDQALTGVSFPELLQGFSEGLVRVGMPIMRAYVAVPSISPDLRAVTDVWRRDRGVVREPIRYAGYTGDFEHSPFKPMVDEDVAFRRWRFMDDDRDTNYPVLEALRAEGARDHLAYIVSFDATDMSALQGAAISFTSDAPAGFSEWHVAHLDKFVPLLGLTACRFALSTLVSDILGAYVGRDAGRRVLRGEMRRGEGHRLTAALMVADLRGFTQAADTGGGSVVQRLGAHLAAMAEPVEDAGGEVLKFMGDGLLAAYPAEEGGPEIACAAMLAAGREALRRNDALNATLPPEQRLGLDVALHLGEVFYGNIGAGSRLDFTVIGPAVNEASRIEALCGALDQAILMSRPFAECCGSRTVSLGSHRLRGVSEARDIFALSDA